MKDTIIWEPHGDYIKKSNIKRFMDTNNIRDYHELIKRSTDDTEWFWEAALNDLGLEWYRPYDKILDDSEGFPWAKWFVGGKINIVHNCIDRHIRDGKGDKTAFIWESDDGLSHVTTYRDLNHRVCSMAAGLKSLGVSKGDTVGIFMPMIPEIIVALYACFKIGAVAVPIFSGFGATALATRLADADVKVLFTVDGSLRRGNVVELKREADVAAASVPSLEKVIVFRRLDIDVPWDEKQDIWWHELIMGRSGKYPTEELDAEDRSLIIYTSGTTGKPKGTIHTHAGCLAQMSKEIGYYFDYQPDDLFFWVTDIGWMMGPWEIIGVQFFGGTYIIFEGVPNHPHPDRLWRMVEQHRITTLGISPTAIRMLMTHDEKWVEKRDLSSLRLLGSTGEPWNTDSYLWYFQKVGGGRCPIINISGGTEIVGCFLAPLPITPLKPCTLGGPGLGMDVDVFDDDGRPIRGGIGHLVCKKPAPSMTKGFLKDPQRYIETYFSRWSDVWYHGDWAEIDEDGFWFLHGRSDDTIKVAGKRTGPAEIETALMEHPQVSEAAAIGIPHEIKGEAIVCFAVIIPPAKPEDRLGRELKALVVKHLGKSLRPQEIIFVESLPKTRSAKIVRGVIKRKYLGLELGDIASVENPEAIEAIYPQSKSD